MIQTLISVLFFFICITFCNQVFGQNSISNGVLTGTVRNEDYSKVSYATLNLLKFQDSILVKGSITDENGNFKIENIPNGDYLLVVFSIGYNQFYSDSFTIGSSNKAVILEDITLVKSTTQLTEVVISGQKPLIERFIDKTVLNIEHSALAAGNTALEILRKAPGVTIDNYGNIGLKGRQGVLVMVDDKPTYLSSEQLNNFLLSTNGDAIKKIELISNPSSKYDAAGNSGIINIKMKKNRNYGTNGNVRLGGGYGSNYKSNGAISLNHRKEKFNIFGNYSFSDYKNTAKLNLLRDNGLDNQVTLFDQTGYSTGHYTNHTYNGGIDYFINPMNTLGIVITGRSATNDINSFNETDIKSNHTIIDSSIIGDNQGTGKFNNVAFNVNFNSIFDTVGQELHFDFNYVKFNNFINNHYNNLLKDPYSPVIPYNVFRSTAPSKINILSFKIDYNYTLGKNWKLNSGLKTSLVETDNDFQFDNLVDESWVRNLNISNRFIYQENINAGYLNFNKKFKSSSVQVGVRAEQTRSDGNSITERKIIKRNYMDFFPSLYYIHELSKNNKVGFSYSRRIERPDYGSLNPFVKFVDLYTFEQGNPYLNSQYSNSFEISNTYKETLNVSVGFSKTDDVISTVLISDPIEKTLFVTQQNLAKEVNYNLSLSSPFTLTKFWNSDNSFTLFYNEFTSPNIMGSAYQSGKLTYQLNSNHSIKISSTFNAELSANYISKQVYGTYGIKPIYGINFSINKSFADNRGNISLSVNDIFNTIETDITSKIPLQNYHLRQKTETRIFRINLAYRFGGKEIKGPSSRKQGSLDEEKRIKSN